jgi:hypothetical protein
MIFRAERFWEAVGAYCVHFTVVELCAEAFFFYSAQSTLFYINTAPLRVSRTQSHIIV